MRAFLADRDLCDHFRSEPWPESGTQDDRARRRQLVDGMNSTCTGTDHRLADLLARYRDHAAIQRLLRQFERSIETGD